MSAAKNNRALRQAQAWRLLPALLWRRDTGLVAVLAAAVLVSALAVVLSVHEVRLAYAKAHEAQVSRDLLLEDRGRLLLERSAWSSYGRVERVARDDLGMVVPGPAQTRVLTLAAAGPVAGSGGGVRP